MTNYRPTCRVLGEYARKYNTTRISEENANKIRDILETCDLDREITPKRMVQLYFANKNCNKSYEGFVQLCGEVGCLYYDENTYRTIVDQIDQKQEKRNTESIYKYHRYLTDTKNQDIRIRQINYDQYKQWCIDSYREPVKPETFTKFMEKNI